jgi:hypothetical protein
MTEKLGLLDFRRGGIGPDDIDDDDATLHADDVSDAVHDVSGVLDEALRIDELLMEMVCDRESVSMALLLLHS